MPCAASAALHFVEQFGENEFKKFFKHINARVCQHLVFHFQNQIFQRFSFGYEFVFFNQVFNRPSFFQNIRKFLVGSRNFRNIFKIVGVFAVIVRNGISVAPNSDWCARGVAVRFELFFPVF